MAIDFPNNPSDGDTHPHNGKTWIWDSAGQSWTLQSSSLSVQETDPIFESEKGVIGGVATLDSEGNVVQEVTTSLELDSDGGSILKYQDEDGVLHLIDISHLLSSSESSESVWTTLSDNDIYYTEGNVGIGLDTPVEKLEVLGNAKITGKILINGVDEKYTDIDLGSVNEEEEVHYFNIDASLSRLFVLDSPISDEIGLKISNLNLAVGSATNLSVVVKQDSSPTLISYIEIDQMEVDIKWQGSNVPDGVAGAMEIFSFTILRETESDYVALSQSIDFS